MSLRHTRSHRSRNARPALSARARSWPVRLARPRRSARRRRLEAESLLLNFGNLVATIQDQLIRSVLIVADEKVEGRSRLDHRHTAEKLGALPDGIDDEGMIKARNQLAHQHPADPVEQALLVNEVIAAAETAIVAFDELAAYAEQLLAKTGGTSPTRLNPTPSSCPRTGSCRS